MNTFKDQESIAPSAGDQLPSFRHPHGPSKGLKGLSAPRHCQGSPNSRRHPRLRSTSIRSTSAHQHGLTSKEKVVPGFVATPRRSRSPLHTGVNLERFCGLRLAEFIPTSLKRPSSDRSKSPSIRRPLTSMKPRTAQARPSFSLG